MIFVLRTTESIELSKKSILAEKSHKITSGPTLQSDQMVSGLLSANLQNKGFYIGSFNPKYRFFYRFSPEIKVKYRFYTQFNHTSRSFLVNVRAFITMNCYIPQELDVDFFSILVYPLRSKG